MAPDHLRVDLLVKKPQGKIDFIKHLFRVIYEKN